jgi:hypothetical protein
LALVTTVAHQDAERIGQLRTLDGLILAIDGVQPEKSHETLSILRDVRSGRVVVAKTRLSSATPEIELLIEEVFGFGLPIVGVISDQQESICLAVQQKLPTVPPQICQFHDVTDVAQPVCEADRHVKKELHKKIRGIRDLERQAENSPSKDAQVVADYCLALRTVMRDDGTYPLEPPGGKLYQQWPLMAASVERVRAVYPSALLTRRSRMLAVLNVFQQAFAQLVILCSWIPQMAHLLTAHTSSEEAQSQLVTCVHELTQRSLPTDWWSVVTDVEKITVAFAPPLCAYLKQPLLPRTKNDLALFIGRIKQSRRHITGRKNTQELILREGSLVAMLFGLPHPNNWGDVFSRVHPHDFQHSLNLLRQTAMRRKCWHARRD